jgi:hypothetical protein
MGLRSPFKVTHPQESRGDGALQYRTTEARRILILQDRKRFGAPSADTRALPEQVLHLAALEKLLAAEFNG